ncbi:peptidylprolyl isomerase [Gilvimarinus agarilyticus]|uniref:FKBP-type peptidyl-prolyl cis-trans isomerase n=1 Tax=unclassified Gilvimarinus TaxID=2642066 RepID=UPI001C085A7E|nr:MULTISPECIES: peptidylprolyl isomerase [unclassified Gilvimarinus]MBU2885214.1 peptidylprolyl isomerase [Gilvimarinus agarilyticus]MDO6570111.1 peptidylprolyl isomerase [Gilvimarinus sp. 2_MG-2023]MDO6748283.1 peptidylprolyl isomerase [Gilvimarinus sp. 1_MG-2023]
MRDLCVGPGTTVTLHFSLSLTDGELVDSNFESKPAQFTVGDGKMLKGFEEALFGLEEGTEEEFLLGPEAGFGAHNPNNVQVVDRSEFDPGITLEEGLMLSFADAQNAELPGVVVEFDDEQVTIDFNHPLAGRDILFKVAVLEIKPATVH